MSPFRLSISTMPPLLRSYRFFQPVSPRLHRSHQTKSPSPQPSASSLLATPTWDPTSLLPTAADIEKASSTISTPQLHHLLRLAGLPPPATAAEESDLRATLAAQLHFVRQVQAAAQTPEIAALEPLASLRDETRAGVAEMQVSRDTVAAALDAEEVKGRYWPRPRRRKDGVKTTTEEREWDVFGNAKRRVGRYFVVEGKSG